MDTLFWKNLQYKPADHQIEIKQATKQFFNQYFYKLEIYAPGCKSIRCENIAVDIDKRQRWVRDYKRQGSWYNKQLYKYLKEADVGFLASLRDLYYEYPDIKIRTEEPKISVYTTDELMIQSVANSIDPDHKNKIISITGPMNEEQKNILGNSTLLVKRPPKYKFRVFLKEKSFKHETRIQIFNYLNTLGDLVSMTPHTQESLTKSHDWIWGCYFYTNDKKVATFVTLINPDIIREVSEFVYMSNK